MSLLYTPKGSVLGLKKVIKKYNKIFEEIGIGKLILKAYRLEKPLTGIEIYGASVSDVRQLVRELKKYFYVVKSPDSEIKNNKFYGTIYVSRFKTLIQLASRVPLTDRVADLAGIIYGYKPKEIAKYIRRLGL